MENDCVLLHHNPSYPFQHSIPHFPPRTVVHNQRELMAYLERLKFFLATAPSRWSTSDVPPSSQQHPALNRFLLPTGEYVTCVLWSGLYHITGTDIVRALIFRFEAFGRPVQNMKKFEEGVFSDLRNLKPGHDASLEEPKSPFLDLLFKFQCIRTQKKQKVFYWYSVPHDRLFLDALERDLKREKMGLEPTTAVVSEPALSFSYDPKRPLFEQFVAATNYSPVESDTEGGLPAGIRAHSEPNADASASSVSLPELDYSSARSSLESHQPSLDGASVHTEPPTPSRAPLNPLARSPFFNMFALFEGSPTYKQRRKKSTKARRGAGDDDRDNVRLSLDSSWHGLDGGKRLDSGRHSLDGSRPIMRSQPRNHTTLLARPSELGITSAVSGLPPFSHVGRLGKHLRAQRVLAPLSAPTSRHYCPLFTCPQSFSDAESLQNHILVHGDTKQHADKYPGDMDVDKHEVGDGNQYAQCVRGTQLQCSPGSSEIVHFTHVLTTPDGSPGYDYEDRQAYTAPSEWTSQSAEIPSYNSAGSARVSSPGYVHSHDTSSSSARSTASSETNSSPSSVVSNQLCYPAKESFSVSAPSDRVNFDPYHPSTAPVDPYMLRRPRSVTPSVPCRVPHARRPSTANEVPSSFGASQSSGYTSSWRHHSASYVPRGYHPYAAPPCEHSYGTESSHSSPGSSPFAVSLNTPASEYPLEASHAGDYGSEGSPPKIHAQQQGYAAATSQQEPSPRLQDQFAHVVGLENASPVENFKLTYTRDPEPYNTSGTSTNNGSYNGSPESVESSNNFYSQGTTEFAPNTTGATYPLGQMLPIHDEQMHPHYFQQQVMA